MKQTAMILGTAICILLASYGLGNLTATPAEAWNIPARPGPLDSYNAMAPLTDSYGCTVTSFVDRKLNAVCFVGHGTCAGIECLRVVGDRD